VGVLLVGCLLVAAFGALLFGRWPEGWPRLKHAATARPATATFSAPALPAPSATPDQLLQAAQAIVAPAAAPARLVVPSIKVDAGVEAVGLDAQGRMATPSQASHVAWFQPGAAPGDVGDAVMAGHLDWTTGPAVFWYLGRVHQGDEITVVRADGTRVRFVTDSTRQIPFDAPTDALFTRGGPPSLTLITCAGTWDRQHGTYLQRLVVHATLAPSVSANRPGDEGG
jgi:sortase (surface protein transpeptidase)